MKSPSHTKHSRTRAKQRAIHDEVVDIIMSFGKREKVPGNCQRIFLPKMYIEKLGKAQIIYNPDADTIVTVEYRHKKTKHK